MEQAIALSQQGDAVTAMTIIKECVREIQNACGDPSMKYAEALSHYATVAFATGDPVLGANQCLAAAESCPKNRDGNKARLTYLMNAGQFLAHSGNASQAIPILKDSLKERIDFYGDGHAGVACGQQVLAEAMLAEEQYEQGLQ